MRQILERLRDVPGVSTAGPPAPLPVANSHIHLPPNFSAFDSIDQAVTLAVDQGIRVLGASNYYEYSIYERFTEAALARGIYPLFGLEIIALLEDVRERGVLINDPGNPGRMYICGKGITQFMDPSDEARRLLVLIRRRDEERIGEVIRRVAECFVSAGVPIDLDPDGIISRVVARHGVRRELVVLQERHVAQAFQEEFFRLVPPVLRKASLERILCAPVKAGAEDHVRTQIEIRAHLMKTGKPAFVPESCISLPEAYRLILELGGIPCYPTLADGTLPICGYEDPPEKLVESLRSNRIYCAEFIPLRNQPDVLERYVLALRRAGFVVTAGTEHNTPDLVPLRPACAGSVPISPELREIFAEGACVSLAHQFLSLQDRCGYVDREGNLNPEFPDPEERIRHFCRLGAAIVAHT